jgi:hypothetical protein
MASDSLTYNVTFQDFRFLQGYMARRIFARTGPIICWRCLGWCCARFSRDCDCREYRALSCCANFWRSHPLSTLDLFGPDRAADRREPRMQQFLPIENGIGLIIPAYAFASVAERYDFAATISKQLESRHQG